MTCDTGQHTRGRAAGLKVTKVPAKDPGPEPDWDALDKPGTGVRAQRRERQAPLLGLDDLGEAIELSVGRRRLDCDWIDIDREH